jgi:hypothetical protein
VIAYCYLRLDREEWIRAVVSAECGASELDNLWEGSEAVRV